MKDTASTNTWEASAPSNIALIKYMGKQSERDNLPLNPSFSYTLPHLTSTVRLTKHDAPDDAWAPFEHDTFQLSEQAAQRFLTHLKRLKNHFQLTDSFLVQSSNQFPQGVGIASSASSFAALTLATSTAYSALTQTPALPTDTMAQLSRQGSGSSCRSFYTPWCLWADDKALVLDTPYPTLIHQVILCHTAEKAVSSSSAHQRVRTSPYYKKRAYHAQKHLDKLITAMHHQNWFAMYEICFEEFIQMHHLFETATPAFHYWTPQIKKTLEILQADWKIRLDGPLITMDAGPTIHLLYRPDQAALADEIRTKVLKHHVFL